MEGMRWAGGWVDGWLIYNNKSNTKHTAPMPKAWSILDQAWGRRIYLPGPPAIPQWARCGWEWFGVGYWPGVSQGFGKFRMSLGVLGPWAVRERFFWRVHIVLMLG